MKIFILIITLTCFTLSSLSANEVNCKSMIDKLKPKCLEKGIDKMKEFSKKNKTLDQSYENIKKKLEKK